MSLVQSKTVEIILAEILMEETVHAGGFLLVEGVDDAMFWRSRVSMSSCKVITCEGKTKVVGVAETLDEQNNQRITEFYRLGYKLALDDFGTGFSSLSHLLNYPINIVKLDKSLLPNTNAEERHLSIVKGISAMARTIGLHIIAEGVETQYQSDLCSELDVDELQGYFFEKALPADELAEKWLK